MSKKKDVRSTKELDLDAALEQVAKKLRPSANQSEDEADCTDAGSCVHTACPECW